jgi:ABC-type amino acid transport substrate-binding protein
MVYVNEIIKVLVVLGEDNDGSATKRMVDAKTGNVTYYGFNWDVWKRVSEKLKGKYDFHTSFTNKYDNNYNSFVEKVYGGEYDIVVGSFFHTAWRETRINYTHPIAIDANAVLHKNEFSVFGELGRVIWKSSEMLIYLIFIGVIVGLFLVMIDPTRAKKISTIRGNKHLFLIRSLLTGIATMFGEMGYLSENSSLRLSGVVFVVIVMALSFVLVMFIQGAITRILINQTGSNVTKQNVGYKRLLGHEGYSVVNKLKRFRANIDVVSNITTDQMIQKYLESEKYDGCVLSYTHGYPYTKKYPDLMLSIDFGYEPVSWVVRQTKKVFNEDVNRELLELTGSTELQRICHSYFGNINAVPVCSLT